jgi:hypothetical protein
LIFFKQKIPIPDVVHIGNTYDPGRKSLDTHPKEMATYPEINQLKFPFFDPESKEPSYK